MERLVGKRRILFGACELARASATHATNGEVLLDIGTGDGRFVDLMARQRPSLLAIGLDACREPLAERSRRAPANAVYVIANALALSDDLDGLATWITLNFPWGSLLDALLARDARLLDRMAAIARPGARVELRLNAGAVTTAGASLEEAARIARAALVAAGFRVSPARMLAASDLRAFPSTWAHRLAFGTDPRAVSLSGRRLAVVGEPMTAAPAGSR